MNYINHIIIISKLYLDYYYVFYNSKLLYILLISFYDIFIIDYVLLYFLIIVVKM